MLGRTLLTLSVALANTAFAAGDDARNLYSKTLPQQDQEQALQLRAGRALFRRLWVSAPASTQAADGLGPLFNARSCIGCHPRNGRGATPQADQIAPASLLMHIDIPAQDADQTQQLASHRLNNIPEPTYGRQLQGSAIAGHAAEQRLRIRYRTLPVTLADGSVVNLRQPDYRIDELGYGPLHPQARLSPRQAPPLIGLGLLAAIDRDDILAQADPDDVDGDGISGRANRVWSIREQRPKLGRFGHKAGQPELAQQIQSAFATDIGLSVPLYPDAAGDCTERQPACREAPNGNTARYDNLEAHRQVTDLVERYVASLAPPTPRRQRDPQVIAGRQLFARIGCAACHTPRFQIDDTATRSIAPYTDLLLHDLGEGLADGRPEGLADGREWRTPPLWGIGLTEQVNGNRNYLHDGRARSLLEAILWHGGEAQAQRDRVVALDTDQRRQLLAFLESL